MVAMDIVLDQVQKIIEDSVSSRRSDYEFILDSRNMVVAHSETAELGKDYAAEVESFWATILAKADEADTDFFEFDYEGNHYVVYAEKIENNWRCLTVKNATKIFTPLKILLAITIFVVVIIVLILSYIMNKSNQRYSIAKKLNEQLSSLSNIYLSAYDIDIISDEFREIQSTRQMPGGSPQGGDFKSASAMLEAKMRQMVRENFLDDVLRFVKLGTLNERLKDSDTVTIEYQTVEQKWRRCRFIASQRLRNGAVSNVLWLIEDIDKEKKERDELLNLSERAFAASEAKSSFLSNMSHEIRTPINAILGMNEIILRECNDAAITSYAESIKTAGSTLLGLINDILDFSKIEAGKIEIIPANYCLSSLLNDLVNMIQIRAQKKGLALSLEFDKNLPKVLHGDEVRIKQVITNILTNAVKYTEKGIVTFSLSFKRVADDPNSIILCVAVKDTGIGIKPEDVKKLYAVFERIEEKRNRNIEGTGLGMAITKNLLHLMKSKLRVESIYGLGTKCSFELKQRVVDWEPLGDYETAYKKSLTEHGGYREKFHAPRAKVLVVDDNEMNLMVFQNLLKQTAVKIDTAINGVEGLRLTQGTKYDVIFLDHMMPDKDGIETLHELKAQSNNPNLATPTICLTANAISGAKEKYLAEGFNGYLTKPINPNKLEEMLLAYLPADKVDKTDSVAPSYKQLNVATGLEYSGGSEEFFRATVEMFCNLRDEKKAKLQAAFAAENWKNYAVFVHALKSTVLSIGGEKLSDAAKQLESAGKILKDDKAPGADKQEAHAFIKTHHGEAMELYDALVEECQRYLQQK